MHWVLEMMKNNPGSDVFLKFPPIYIHVEVPEADPQMFKDKSLIKGKVVIPVRLTSKEKEHKVYFPARNDPVIVKIKPHAVELAFGITIHKMQGQTCSRLILDLNKRPFKPSISYHGLYVALSRVRNSQHIRLLPLQPHAINFNYLFKLSPPKMLTDWNRGFNLEGEWSSNRINPRKLHRPSQEHRGKRTQTIQPSEAT